MGNIILLVVMKRESLFQFGGYLTLAHFSICDFLNALIGCFYYPIAVLTKTHHPWVAPVIMFAESSRKVFIGYMTISRFWAIMFPFSGQIYFDLAHTKKWMIVVWVMSFVLNFPMCYPGFGVILDTEINQWVVKENGPAHFPI